MGMRETSRGLSKQSLTRFLGQLPVSQKIGLGYILAMSISVVGTTAGIVLGNSLAKHATQEANYAAQKIQVLSQLQSGLLNNKAHRFYLQSLTEEPQLAIQELQEIGEISETLMNSWTQIERMVREIESTPQLHIHRKLPEFYKAHEDSVPSYIEKLEQESLLLAQLTGLSEQEQQVVLQQFLSQLSADRSHNIDVLIRDLNQLLVVANEINQAAQLEAFQARSLSNQISVISLLLSVLAATILALLISRSMISPLKAAAVTAQKVVEEEDFDLRVTVTTADEVGTVGKALNQLIEWVEIRTEALEQANDTLEAKVEQRTSELNSTLQELQKSQAQIIQAEKMSSLGQLVAGVAHEINNPVGFLSGNLKPAQDYIQDLLGLIALYQSTFPNPGDNIEEELEAMDLEFVQEDLPQLISSMQAGVDRIHHISNSLRTFSRTDCDRPTRFDIHKGLESTLLILKHRLKANSEHPEIKINKQYGDFTAIDCYAGQLNQVFMNILANAIDAFEDANSGKTFQDIQDHPNEITIITSAIDSTWIQISIADNGPGIPKEIQNRIFEPFFTTKGVGKGTGMGMSLSHQIITEKHQGKLVCISTSDTGTEFIIQLPIQQNG